MSTRPNDAFASAAATNLSDDHRLSQPDDADEAVDRGVIRIPPQTNVPLPRRVAHLIDTSPMRRLSELSQLGVVSLVYPGARHTRFEHTLGVYHAALRVLESLERSAFFQQRVSDTARDAFILAALLHDVGHWPFCHPIEDLDLGEIPRHESRIAEIIDRGELREAIRQDWRCGVDDVLKVLGVAPDRSDADADADDDANSLALRFFASCLSGAIDIDKLDYLMRDSLHAGVPYGSHFDAPRLIDSITVHPDRPRLAIRHKGRTAAELMVMARYVMFSEVYWHRAVRSATAMLQRSIFLLQNRIDLPASLDMTDAQWIAMVRTMAAGSVAEPMVEGLFGRRRKLYKTVLQCQSRSGPSASDAGSRLHAKLARRPYWYLVETAQQFAARLTDRLGVPVHAADVLLDAPPVKLEVNIDIDIVHDDGGTTPLADMSPLASALAHDQFSNRVKSVRVFVRDELRDTIQSSVPQNELIQTLSDVVDTNDRELV